MILNARDGNTTRGFRAFSNKAEIAHFIDSMAPGDHAIIERFIRMDGKDEELVKVQVSIAANKMKGSRYVTKIQDGAVHVWRVT